MRPITTLFSLISVDGKISTGNSVNNDFDSDIPLLGSDASSGLHQYYEIEQTMPVWSLVTGRTMAKLGANTKPLEVEHSIVNYVLVDSHHLTGHGIKYMSSKANKLFVVTSNKNHKMFNDTDNITIIYYEDKVDFADLFERLYTEFGCDKLCVQSGGKLNSELIRKGLIDNIDIVVSPILVGGKDTTTIMDGLTFKSIGQVKKGVARLSLLSCDILEDSYIRLRYKIVN